MKREKKSTGYLEFNNKRACGLWLLLVGAVLGISLIFGEKFTVNPIIFLTGYYISFYVANINRKIRLKLSDGPASPFQIRMIYLSIGLLFILMFLIAGPFIPNWDWKMIWLGVSLATGIHFIPFYFVHGKSMLVLGTACIIITASGYIFASVPVALFLAADSLIKIGFGIWMLFFARPTKAFISAPKTETNISCEARQ